MYGWIIIIIALVAIISIIIIIIIIMIIIFFLSTFFDQLAAKSGGQCNVKKYNLYNLFKNNNGGTNNNHCSVKISVGKYTEIF